MNNQHVIATLNEIIETCKDGEKGFSACAENVADTELKDIFMQRSQHCAASAKELQDEVRRQGGAPDTQGSVAGTLHRGWLNVKSAITGQDEAAVLTECERGEDMAILRYEDALARELPSNTRSLVERQYQGVIANHELVRLSLPLLPLIVSSHSPWYSPAGAQAVGIANPSP